MLHPANRVFFVVAVSLLAACAVSTEPIRVEAPLNSTLIKEKFGSYGVDLIAQETKRRITSLYSLVDGRPVTRTLAIVGYLDDIPAQISDVHAKIISGNSLGQSFVDHGFEVVKETAVLMKLPSNQGLVPLYEMMNLEKHTPLAYHTYVLKVRKNSDWIAYARVTEVHSPEHLKIKELAKRLGEDDYFREKHPYTTIVMRDFRSFLNLHVVPARAQTGS